METKSIKSEDQYDQAINYFNQHPEEIEEAIAYLEHTHSCLFWNAGTHKTLFLKIGEHWLGNPIYIREDHKYVAEEPRLTEEIRADNFLPASVADTRLQHLQRLAWWQRHLDMCYRRLER